MIPDLILCGNCASYTQTNNRVCDCCGATFKYGGGRYTHEYFSRTPIAKKFSEEKPTETGWYMIYHGDTTPWTASWYYQPNDTWNHSEFTFTDACRIEHRFSKPIYWSEIILPIVEGE